MTYPETVQYLESFVNYEKAADYPYKVSFKLGRVKSFLEMIGNPQEDLRCLHIAGTKGKGSTCAFTAYILREAGYKVGLYTSPHLSDIRERIRILAGVAPSARHQAQGDFEGMIPRDDMRALVEKFKPVIEEHGKYSGQGRLSFFEVYTSLAFIYFKEKSVDFAVLETGMGGRLDATNALNSLAAAITPISYEHTQYLGATLREIALEKAGIIKNPGLPVVSAPQEKEAAEVIGHRCLETGARLYEVGRNITYRRLKDSFEIKGPCGNYPELKIRLLGEHQLVNAATAVGLIDALRQRNLNITQDAVRKGLYNTLWPARCEVISAGPFVVLDGAQNASSMRALREALERNFKYRKLVLVFGISADKDIKGMSSEIAGLADTVILTRSGNPRAADPEGVSRYFRCGDIRITQSVKEAKALAGSIAKEEDLILVCGSLFVAGEYRDAQV